MGSKSSPRKRKNSSNKKGTSTASTVPNDIADVISNSTTSTASTASTTVTVSKVPESSFQKPDSSEPSTVTEKPKTEVVTKDTKSKSNNNIDPDPLSSFSSFLYSFLTAPIKTSKHLIYYIVYFYIATPIIAVPIFFLHTALVLTMLMFAKPDDHPDYVPKTLNNVKKESEDSSTNKSESKTNIIKGSKTITKKNWVSLEPTLVDFAKPDSPEVKSFTRHTLEEHILRSEPIILRNLHLNHKTIDIEKDKEYNSKPLNVISDLPPLQKDIKRGSSSQESMANHILLEVGWYPKDDLGPGLKKFLFDHCGGRVCWNFIRFAGGYNAGLGHIDSMPSYTFYVMVKGSKQVYLIPRIYNPSKIHSQEPNKLHFLPGTDNVYIAGDTTDGESINQWLNGVPGVWDFQLLPGDCLLFNNSGICHKFINLYEPVQPAPTPGTGPDSDSNGKMVVETPEIYAIHLSAFRLASVLSMRNDCWNWPCAKLMAQTFMCSGGVRKTDYS